MNQFPKYKDQLKILDLLNRYGHLTSKQASRLMNKPLNCISGRFTELKNSFEIEETGRVIEGCREFRLAENQMKFILQ